MWWRSSSPSLLGVLCISIIFIHYASGLETQIRDEDRAPNSDTVIHHPAASLSIAGDLKDLKLKSSIAQLVRALQTPPVQAKGPHESMIPLIKPPELITKHNSNVHSTSARKLVYGQPEEVPSPITISSQAIRINSNKTGGKGRGRSMVSLESEVVDADGIRTIEGVRVPDDEHDKHHTWRNARVIKGFLVPNDKSPNPHRKRQVVVHTDPQSYLAAAAAAQAQGATALMGAAQQQPQQGRRYSQTDLANAAAAYISAQTQQNQAQQRYQTYQQNQPQYHPQQASQPQPVQQPHQYQTQTYQLPSAARASQPQPQYHQSGQTTAFAYPQTQSQPGQMYVLQDDGGNTYLQYSPDSQRQTQTQPQFLSHLSHSQSQFSSRSGEPETPTQAQKTPSPSANNSPQPQQKVADGGVQAALQHAIQSTLQGQVATHQGVPVPQASAQQATAPVSQVPKIPDVVGSEYIIQQVPAQASGTSVVQLPPQSRQIPGEYSVSAASGSSFVIQPQTYITGPGGQTFTIPIPIPADQAQSANRPDWHHAHALQSHQPGKQPHPKSRNNNIAEKVMDALNSNRKALEGLDTTTAVVPALASTGIFLGLTALAAGWYLSKGNREVGIVRRTGKPAGGGYSRFRRDVAQPVNSYPQEVDQATFFQSIIQQSLEKTQQQYENQAASGDQIYSHIQQPEPVYNREPEREPERSHRPSKNFRNNRPQNRNDDEFYDKSSKNQIAQEKSGPLTVASSKNFAKVFVPALILGLSVISITALIFFWYITGANREIAFLEPSSHTRKKRSLMGSTALSDGWLQRTITAIHHNPYDRIPAPTSKSLLPHPFMDRETSKTSDLEFKISNAAITGVIAGGALIALVALGLANSLSDTPSRQLKAGRANSNPSSFSVNNFNNPHLKHLRAPRSLNLPDGYNDLAEAPVDSPGYMASILSTIEDAHQSLITSLHDSGLLDAKSPCCKRLVCELLLSEVDQDTLRTTEKRITNFFDVLPDSVAKPWKDSIGEIVSSVQKGDCSAFSCGSHSASSSR